MLPYVIVLWGFFGQCKIYETSWVNARFMRHPGSMQNLWQIRIHIGRFGAKKRILLYELGLSRKNAILESMKIKLMDAKWMFFCYRPRKVNIGTK